MPSLFQHLDTLHSQTQHAKTLGVMLHDLLCADDEITDLDINDPAGRVQRMFVVLETLQDKVKKIDEIEVKLRQEAKGAA